MHIYKCVRKVNEERWAEFVSNHPNGNIFQSPEFYHVYKETTNYEPLFLGVLDEDNNLHAVLLAVIQKDFKGILGNFTARSIIYGGPIIKENNIFVLDILLNEYNKIIEKNAIYTQLRNFTPQSEEVINNFARHKYTYVNHLNIIINLSIGVDLLWKGCKSNRKDGINKGKRQNFVFEVTNDVQYIDPFYKLLKQTFERAKLPFPKIDFFCKLVNVLKNQFKWFILKKDNEPIIILLAFTNKGIIYAFYIGIIGDNEVLKLRPVDYFYWMVIKWGVENNFNYFDWMGAGKPEKDYGVRKFKLQYGGELLEMGRFERTHKPLFMELGKFGLKIFKKIR